MLVLLVPDPISIVIFRGCLVSCTRAEPDPPHADPSVLLAAPFSEPDYARAEEPSRPGSSGTLESAVSKEQARAVQD